VTTWQFIAVCLALMFLLPLVFYLASRRPPRRLVVDIPHKDEQRKKQPARPRPESEEDDSERREPRRRKAIEDGDEIEYRDRK